MKTEKLEKIYNYMTYVHIYVYIERWKERIQNSEDNES